MKKKKKKPNHPEFVKKSKAHQVEEGHATQGLNVSLGVVQSQLVKLVFTQSRTNTLQVGDITRELFDGLHLLLKEVLFNEVHHLPEK